MRWMWRCLVVVGLLLVVASCGGGERGTVRSTGGGDAATSAEPSEEVPGSGDRLDVGNADGEVVGSFSRKAGEERSRRISHRLIDEQLLGDEEHPVDDEARARLIEALQVVDPLEVTDERGELVGYFTTSYVSLEDYPAAKAEAEATIERLRPAP